MTKLTMTWILVALNFVVGGIALTMIGFDAQVPIHFNAAGEPDRYGSALFGLFILPVTTLLSTLFIIVIRRFDPKQDNLPATKATYGAIILAVAGLMLLLEVAIVLHSLEIIAFKELNIFGAVGLLFIVIGNYLPKTRSNWFVGIRTPWTLSNEEIWRKTHILGGYLFMVAGALVFLGSLFFSQKVFFPIFMGLTLTSALIPVLYSLILWVKLSRAA